MSLVKAVRRDRRRVDEPPSLGVDRRLEDVARALEVDPPGLVAVAEDDEREMDDDVGAGDQVVDRSAVQNVALHVLGPLPAVALGVERPARHADDPAHLRPALELADRRPPDVAGRAGHRNRQGLLAHHPTLSPAALAAAGRYGVPHG